mmetsp:Transcript_5601/g.9270  ORF Transcript_5601/g.9270 Transcript_5601/m.9270 type:complete len:414 (-) Transcript_5601:1247-2488(-)
MPPKAGRRAARTAARQQAHAFRFPAPTAHPAGGYLDPEVAADALLAQLPQQTKRVVHVALPAEMHLVRACDSPPPKVEGIEPKVVLEENLVDQLCQLWRLCYRAHNFELRPAQLPLDIHLERHEVTRPRGLVEHGQKVAGVLQPRRLAPLACERVRHLGLLDRDVEEVKAAPHRQRNVAPIVGGLVRRDLPAVNGVEDDAAALVHLEEERDRRAPAVRFPNIDLGAVVVHGAAEVEEEVARLAVAVEAYGRARLSILIAAIGEHQVVDVELRTALGEAPRQVRDRRHRAATLNRRLRCVALLCDLTDQRVAGDARERLDVLRDHPLAIRVGPLESRERLGLVRLGSDGPQRHERRRRTAGHGGKRVADLVGDGSSVHSRRVAQPRVDPLQMLRGVRDRTDVAGVRHGTVRIDP